MPSSYVIEVPYRIVYSTFLFFASIEARFCLIAIEARISEAKTLLLTDRFGYTLY
jgi:hypothetical protein